ncbi:MAG: glycosyltransferase, partial [Candidatus Latescibacterota bacterium]
MRPCVVMRARNDMPLVAATLAMLARQQQAFELVAFDNASTDGTLRELRCYTHRVHCVPAGAYVPGRVLNEAMHCTRGEVVVFLNSDCTPVNEHWLGELLAGLAGTRTAAVFGRQVPRPGCHPLLARDTEDTFGDGVRHGRWRHCFSMASSAIRRSVWEEMPFDEELQYSEDIDWTWRARQRGYAVRYAPRSAVYHSHNYSLTQLYRRQYGEGKAEARILPWPRWRRLWVRYSLLPFGRTLLGDWRHCLREGEARAAVDA